MACLRKSEFLVQPDGGGNLGFDPGHDDVLSAAPRPPDQRLNQGHAQAFPALIAPDVN